MYLFSRRERPSAADWSCKNKMSPPSRLVWANVLRSDLQQVHCGFDSTERQVVIVVVQCKEHQTSRVTTAWGRQAGWKSVDGKVLCFVFGREGRQWCDWFLESQRGCLLSQILRRICTLVMDKIYISGFVKILTLGKTACKTNRKVLVTSCSCKFMWSAGIPGFVCYC